MSVLPPPPPDAGPTKRGLVSKGPAEQAFDGPKRFLKTLTADRTLVAGDDWEREEAIGPGVVVTGLPVHFGGYGEEVANLFAIPGFRRFFFNGDEDTATFVLGIASDGTGQALGFEFEEATRNAQFHGATLYVPTLEVGELTVGGVPVTPGGGGGVDTIGAVGSTPNAGGASIGGSTLTLQPADASNPGVVDLNHQVLGAPGAAKTFAIINVEELRALGAIALLRANGPLNLYAGGTTGITETIRLIGQRADDGLKSVVVGTESASPHKNAVVCRVAKGVGTAANDTANGVPLLDVFGDGRVESITGASISPRGSYGCDGDMTNDEAGDQTIDAAKGRAVIAAGESSITVMNDEVSEDGFVNIVWETPPCDQATNALAGWGVEYGDGFFVVTIYSEFETPCPARADTAFRFNGIQ